MAKKHGRVENFYRSFQNTEKNLPPSQDVSRCQCRFHVILPSKRNMQKIRTHKNKKKCVKKCHVFRFFPKKWQVSPTNPGFPTKNDDFGGYHHPCHLACVRPTPHPAHTGGSPVTTQTSEIPEMGRGGNPEFNLRVWG